LNYCFGTRNLAGKVYLDDDDDDDDGVDEQSQHKHNTTHCKPQPMHVLKGRDHYENFMLKDCLVLWAKQHLPGIAPALPGCGVYTSGALAQGCPAVCCAALVACPLP
jgi:hypothetical protein